MNILVVSSYLPYPLFSGGSIRLYNLLKEIAKKHTITLVCELRDYQTKDDIAEVKKYCTEVITVPRKKQWSIKHILKTGFSLDPFLITGHTSSDMQQKIQNLLQHNHFDLIHAETFYIMQNIPTTAIPIVLVEHNIEYLVYKRYADNAMLPMRPLLYLDVYKMKQKEEAAWKRAAKLVAVSEKEKEVMGSTDVVVVPNGVALDMFPFVPKKQKQYRSLAKSITMPEKELLFIGDFKWIQNRDTVRWIMQDIWPFLLRAVESDIKIKLRVVGKNIPAGLKSLNMFDSIYFDEQAPKETAGIFQQADVLLTPTRVGGGTSYKILEAMASGTPVVTTTLGAEGLPLTDMKDALIADEVQSIVEKTAHVLRDKELYTTIRRHARQIIESEYDWKTIAKTLQMVYETVVE